MQDQLIKCPKCGGNACYEQHLEDGNKTYFCFGCGSTTNTLMVEESDLHKSTLEAFPELYRDLQFVDSEKRVWFPCTINNPELGIVFIDGKSKDDWKWKGIKSERIPGEEASKYPQGQEFRVRLDTAMEFEKTDFMEAVNYIGLFETLEEVLPADS